MPQCRYSRAWVCLVWHGLGLQETRGVIGKHLEKGKKEEGRVHC